MLNSIVPITPKNSEKKLTYDFISAGRIVLLAFCFSFIASYVLLLIFTPIANSNGESLSTDFEVYRTYSLVGFNTCVTYVILNTLFSQLSFLLAIVLYNKIGGFSFNSIQLKKEGKLSLSLVSILLAFIAYFTLVQLFNLIDIGFANFGNFSTLSLPLDSPIWVFVNILVYAVLPPIIEEMLFRGVLLSGMQKRFSPFLSSVFVSLIFALAHGSIASLLYPFLLSMLLCTLVQKTGDIKYGMIIHFLNNTLTVIFGFLTYNKYIDLNYLTSWWGILLAIICFLAFFILCFVVFKFAIKNQSPNKVEGVEQTEKLNQKGKISYSLLLYCVCLVTIVIVNLVTAISNF